MSTYPSTRGKGACSSPLDGGVAQLVEHLVCNQGVVGSNPIASTTLAFDGELLSAILTPTAPKLLIGLAVAVGVGCPRTRFVANAASRSLKTR